MKTLKLSIIAITLALTTGCSTIFMGSDQNVNITTTDPTARCTIMNASDVRHGSGTAMSTNIDRSPSNLHIICKGDSTHGAASVDPRFMAEWLLIDVIWDACILTLSCLIDGATGNFYDYPDAVHIPMVPLDQPIQQIMLPKPPLAINDSGDTASDIAKPSKSTITPEREAELIKINKKRAKLCARFGGGNCTPLTS